MRKVQKKSGETLVEILVSIFLFLMLASVMQAAMVFCGNAWQKSKEIRQTNQEICRNLRTTPYTSGSQTELFEFYAFSPEDGAGTGGTVLFRVQADLGRKEVSYTENGVIQTCPFYRFGKVGGGGGS